MTAAGKQRTFLGHPLGLYILFFTEMWERFSYYGMRALLMLYMVNYFKWTQKDASTTYKIYTSAVYVTPIIGGYLADRFLGNKFAVIIGALLMAIGHFLMAFEEYPIFMAALIFLIIGNGFFKPNMSTQVGRLYPPNDGRRDGAYTIFYMGINLGAFLSPLACGWLADNTVGGFHSGFTLAGIGMVIGLIIYLLGQPWIKELPPETTFVENKTAEKSEALSETEAARVPSALGILGSIAPALLQASGAALIALSVFFYFRETMIIWDALLLGIGGGCLGIMGLICAKVTGGVRDRVLAILILGIFVIFFWAAFEQAGNVLNIWADQSTNRYLTREAPSSGEVPTIVEDAPKKDGEVVEKGTTGFVGRFAQLFRNMVTLKPNPGANVDKTWSETVEDAVNPVPTASFQSINALAIFIIAPFFAWLWLALDRRGWQPSIPMKMFLGLVFMSASMAIMMGAAKQENRRSTISWTGTMPPGIIITPENKLAHKPESGAPESFHAGRLTWDAATHILILDGVLDENVRDRIIEATAPEAFEKKIKELQKASKDIDGDKVLTAKIKLDQLPPGFDMKYAGLKKSIVDYQNGEFIAYKPLADKEVKGLLVAGGEPSFRTAVRDLFVRSTQFRVSPSWLFWSYILATLGELCLSPVGLSMVSKLAPIKFATMLMGMWLLTSAFGNFAAGALGELWGTIPPIDFFLFSTAFVGAAALVLLVLVRIVTKTMHGVK